MLFRAPAAEAIETAVTTTPAVPPAAPTSGPQAVEAVTTTVVTTTPLPGPPTAPQSALDPAVMQQITNAVKAATSTVTAGQIVLAVCSIATAIVAGAFGLRIAKKTPHENLKSLVEIRKELLELEKGIEEQETKAKLLETGLRAKTGVRIDTEGVVDKAIQFELAKLDRHSRARAEVMLAWLKLDELNPITPYTNVFIIAERLLRVVPIVGAATAARTAQAIGERESAAKEGPTETETDGTEPGARPLDLKRVTFSPRGQ